MSSYTKGDWKFNMLNDLGVEGDSESICHITRRVNIAESEANAHLIVSAVNACIKLNPDNPLAVADSITELYEALKLTKDNLQTLSDAALHYKKTFSANLEILNLALAKVDNPSAL